jgi:hypothetical protein
MTLPKQFFEAPAYSVSELLGGNRTCPSKGRAVPRPRAYAPERRATTAAAKSQIGRARVLKLVERID